MGCSALLRARVREYFPLVAFALTLICLLDSVASAQTSAVQWTNLVNATATGSALQKTGGCSGCPDAGATSVETLNQGDGFVEFVPLSGARLYAGLGTNATTNTDPASIDFAFSFWPDGGWDVREQNVYRTEGRFVSGDVFRVAIVSGAVKYFQNGALVYSSLVQPGPSLVLDTTLIGAGATLTSATTSVSVAPIADRAAVIASSNSGTNVSSEIVRVTAP